MSRANVGNAADREQVKNAERLLKDEHQQFLFDLRKVLDTREGRRVMWKMLDHCNVFGSIMETSAKIYYNSGRQDVGHWLLAKIDEARPTTGLLMAQEDAKEKEDGRRQSRRSSREAGREEGRDASTEDAGDSEA